MTEQQNFSVVGDNAKVIGTIHKIEVFNQIIEIKSLQQLEMLQLKIASPYKGLKSFETVDKGLFFGRDQFLKERFTELDQTNLILLLGASGSGKSSLVRAGMIPRLAELMGAKFVDLTFIPNHDPFASLYYCLRDRYPKLDCQQVLEGKTETLVQAVNELKPADDFWFIFIDQFEELFTLSPPEQRDRFIESLVQLVKVLDKAQHCSVKIVATMRADFLDRLSPYPAFVKQTNQHRPIIAEMQLDELRLAIEQPALHHGVVFEPGLVEEIIKDVQGQAGYLPLLQYTLNLLWKTEVETGSIHDRTLNISNYRDLGGVRGTLQKHVEEVYQALSQPEQLAVQRMFLKLVGIGGNEEAKTEWKPIRRRAKRSEFDDQLEQKVMARLINENLLVSSHENQSQESTIEIAHEVLLTSWTTLNTWIKQNRQDIALRNRLNDDVELWQAKKAESDLWSGSKLAQVVELRRDPSFQQVLGGFSTVANQFIDASVGWRDRQRQRVLLGLSGFSVVALALAGFALYQLHQAQRQATVAQLREQAARVLDWLPTANATEGLVLAIDTMNRSQSDPVVDLTAQSSLLSALQEVQEVNRLQGHGAVVNSVAFSSDGRRIVSGSFDKTVRLWDAQSGQPIGQPLQGHRDKVNSVAFSPDGRRIVSGSEDRTVRLWDAQSGQPIGQPLQGHRDKVNSVAFSPDGRRIVSGSGDRTVRLWDAQSGQPIGQLLRGHRRKVTSVAFSPDGHRIVSGSFDKTVRLWDAQTGQPIGQPLKGHDGKVYSVAFSPDGHRIVNSSEGGAVRLWDAQSGQPIGQSLKGHGAAVRSVAFSPDGRRIVSGNGNDRTVQMWDAQTGQPIGQPLKGHGDAVSSVAFSPDGRRIVSGSGDRTVRLWDAQTDQLIGQSLQGHGDTVSSVAFNPNSRRIVSGSKDTTVRLWDAQSGQPIGQPFQGHGDAVYLVAFSPDGRRIVSGSEDTTVQLWDAQSGQPIDQPLRGHGYDFSSVAFSLDGRLIISDNDSDNGRTLRLWDAQSGQPIGQPLQGHTAVVSAVAFSLDGRRIVSGSEDTTVRLWDAQSGQPIGEPFQGHGDAVYSVAFSPDGRRIVSGGGSGSGERGDNTVRLWDAQSGQPIGQPLQGHTAVVSAVAFSPDGRRIVSGSKDTTVRLWDAQSGQPIGQPFQGHGDAVYSVAFSPDGRHIVSGSKDTTVRLWPTSSDDWLALTCTRLQYHPLLNQPETVISDPEFLAVAKRSRTVCQQKVWRKHPTTTSQSPSAQLPLMVGLREAIPYLTQLFDNGTG